MWATRCDPASVAGNIVGFGYEEEIEMERAMHVCPRLLPIALTSVTRPPTTYYVASSCELMACRATRATSPFIHSHDTDSTIVGLTSQVNFCELSHAGLLSQACRRDEIAHTRWRQVVRHTADAHVLGSAATATCERSRADLTFFNCRLRRGRRARYQRNEAVQDAGRRRDVV